MDNANTVDMRAIREEGAHHAAIFQRAMEERSALALKRLADAGVPTCKDAVGHGCFQDCAGTPASSLSRCIIRLSGSVSAEMMVK